MIYDYGCTSDFIYLGWSEGEKAATTIRVFCVFITLSILSSWCSKANISRLLLFFVHWLSGLVHLLAKSALGEMVQLCWMRNDVIGVIKTLKFLELVAANMLAVTNLAICVNLALIIYCHRNVSRVKSLTSPKLMLAFLAISLFPTVTAAPLWDIVATSGAHVWVGGASTAKSNWVVSSQYLLEFIGGIVMFVIVLFLVIFRRPELQQVWKLHRRIRYYFGLTLIAIVADLGISIGGTLLLAQRYNQILMVFAFSCRNLHIALDTVVLYYGLGATRFHIEGTSSASSEEGGCNHRHRAAGGRPAITLATHHVISKHKSSGKNGNKNPPTVDRVVATPFVC